MPATPVLPSRRRIALLGAVALTLGTSLPLAQAQTTPWPNQPIKLVVGFPAGSSPDLMARILSEPLAQALGQPVVVENRAGAGGNIAAAAVARATDDHTLGLMINGNLTIAKILNPATPYDPQTDLTPVSLLAVAPLVLTAPITHPPTARRFSPLHAKAATVGTTAHPVSAPWPTSAWNSSSRARASHHCMCPTPATRRSSPA